MTPEGFGYLLVIVMFIAWVWFLWVVFRWAFRLVFNITKIVENKANEKTANIS